MTLDGGTIRASDNANPDWIMGLTGFTVGAKGGTLDTQAKDVQVDAKEALQSVGRMMKTGSGKLSVHSLAFNGGLTVAEGTLAVAADAPGAIYGVTESLAHRWSFSGTLVGGAKIVGAGNLNLSACTLKLGEATATEAAIRNGHGSWLVAMTTDGQVILPEGFRRTVKEARFGLKVSEDGASVYVTHAPGLVMIVK